MIDIGRAQEKSSNEYLESIRQKLGLGHSDQATKRTHKKEIGKNDFIKLMSVQLQHQDPTSPLKNEEMAAQLAQFSSLEQMQNINTTLEKMSNETKSRDSLMASQFIGKEVVTDSSRFEIDEDRRADLKFELKEDIENGTVAIFNQNNKTIREIEIGKLKGGLNSIKWDGRDKAGIEADVGAYSFRITAYNKDKAPVEAKTGTTGMVAGIEFENGRPVLLVDDKRFPLSDITKIQEPLNKDQAANSVIEPSVVEGGEIASKDGVAVEKHRENGTKDGGISRVNPQEGLENMKLFNPFDRLSARNAD